LPGSRNIFGGHCKSNEDREMKERKRRGSEGEFWRIRREERI
jgi:hypothetical protein